MRSLPIFVIWPNYATGAILRDSKTAIVLVRARMLISRPSRDRPVLNFCARLLPILVSGVIMLPMQFRAILRLQFFYTRTRMLISRPSQEYTF